MRVLQTVVGIIVGFLMMPFLIGALGEESYGVWVVVSSIAATFYLLDAGFSSAVTRFSAKYIHESKYKEANAIISTAVAIYSILGFVVLIVSFALAKFGVGEILEERGEVDLVQVLLLIFGVQLALEFPAKALPGVINAYVRYDTIAIIRTLKTIADALLIWIAISSGYGLLAMAIICMVTSIISTICYILVVKSLFRQINISIASINSKIFYKIFHFSKWVFAFDVSAMMKQKVDVWAVAYFMGPASLTVYYVAVRLTEYAVKFMLQATDMSTPIFIEHHTAGRKKQLAESLSMFIRAGIFLSCVGLLGFYLVGKEFIELWMPDEFPVFDAWQLLLILAVARFGVYMTAPMQSVLLTLHRHELSAIMSIFELVCCCFLCFILIPKYGLMGAAIAMAAPVVFVRGVIFPALVQRLVPFFSYEDLFRVFIFLVFMSFSGFLIESALTDFSLVNWMVIIVGCGSAGLLALIGSIALIHANELVVLRSQIQRFL